MTTQKDQHARDRLGCELRVLTPSRLLQRVPPSSHWWKWLGYADKFVLFIPTLALQTRRADVVHICDHSNSMYVRWVKSKATVVTCHDVIAVQAARGMVEGWTVGWSGRVLQRGLRSEDKHLIHVGSDLPRKNRKAVAETFIALQRRAAAVGDRGAGLRLSGFHVRPGTDERSRRGRCVLSGSP